MSHNLLSAPREGVFSRFIGSFDTYTPIEFLPPSDGKFNNKTVIDDNIKTLIDNYPFQVSYNGNSFLWRIVQHIRKMNITHGFEPYNIQRLLGGGKRFIEKCGSNRTAYYVMGKFDAEITPTGSFGFAYVWACIENSNELKSTPQKGKLFVDKK